MTEPKMPDASAWTGTLDEALDRLRYLATPQRTGRVMVDARDRYALAFVVELAAKFGEIDPATGLPWRSRTDLEDEIRTVGAQWAQAQHAMRAMGAELAAAKARLRHVEKGVREMLRHHAASAARLARESEDRISKLANG